MKRLGRVVVLVVGLAASATTACNHGRCELSSGMATCSAMNEFGCKEFPACRWEQACVVATSCYSADQATCEALDYCKFGPEYCYSTAEQCEPLPVENCGSDKRCGLSMACRGGPLAPCEPHDDQDSCEADLHCDWNSSPAL